MRPSGDQRMFLEQSTRRWPSFPRSEAVGARSESRSVCRRNWVAILAAFQGHQRACACCHGRRKTAVPVGILPGSWRDIERRIWFKSDGFAEWQITELAGREGGASRWPPIPAATFGCTRDRGPPPSPQPHLIRPFCVWGRLEKSTS